MATTFTTVLEEELVIVSVEKSIEHDRTVFAWCKENGIQIPQIFLGETSTLCGQSTIDNTNTVNNDDHADNIQDQVTDDSMD